MHGPGRRRSGSLRVRPLLLGLHIMTDLAPDATAPAVKRILCPIDFSDASGHVIDQAVAFAGWYNAAIFGLHVCTPLVVPTMTMGPIEGTPQIDLDRMQ